MFSQYVESHGTSHAVTFHEKYLAMIITGPIHNTAPTLHSMYVYMHVYTSKELAARDMHANSVFGISPQPKGIGHSFLQYNKYMVIYTAVIYMAVMYYHL